MLFEIDDYYKRVKLAYNYDEENDVVKKFMGYDLNFRKLNYSLFSYESLHKFGIIHLTADIILVLPDNRIIVQKRSQSTDIPDMYAPSAGGHCVYNLTEKETAINELREELGLIINGNRIENIFKNEHPIQNYLYRKEVILKNQTFILQKFTPKGKWYSNEVKPFLKLTKEDSRLETKSYFFNQELAYFFIAYITYEELEKIKINLDEVHSIEILDILCFKSMINDLNFSSDSFFIMNKYKIDELLQKAIK